MSEHKTWSRDFEIRPEQRNERQAALVRRIEEGPRGRVTINYRMWLHNMDLAEVAEPFGLYLTYLSPVTKRQKEILILAHAAYWDAKFEWNIHKVQAKAVGITDEQIQSIKQGRPPGFGDVTEDLTYELARALHVEREVNDDLYARCMEQFGHKGVSDLIGLIGLYTMAAMSLCFYQVPIDHAPPWAKLPFKLSND